MLLGQRMVNFSRQGCLRLARPRSFVESTSICSLGRGKLRAGYASLSRNRDDGRTVIVTGSSRGIGKAIALRLAADGYDVCVNDVGANRAGCDEVVKEIQSMGRRAVAAIADVSKRDEVKQMVQTSVKELGPLSTMIANAGIAQVKWVLELTEQDFERMFAVNVFGVQNCFAEAALQMIKQGTCKPERPGKLVAAASVASYKAFDTLPHYSASKFAVRGLTQVYAMDLAQNHITANAYAPGIIGTDMWDLIDAEATKRKGLPRGAVMKQKVDGETALRRAGTAEDVAKLVSFLASSDSDFVTGQTQIVDGGVYFT
ncbi:NAD(P)-binding protein [Jackrogersella minutella]|nr:NAD(P)-binding protein [Jackrogersella minutella]